MRIACLGGGPGGLLTALLAKRSDPDREVTVFERNQAGDTFGFGVVFSDATLEGIDAADPVLRTALTEHGVHWDPIEVRLRGERWTFRGNGMAAVSRRTLLTLLQQRALDAGVDIRFSSQPRPQDLLGAGYDLVVAADGANSAIRARFAGVFGPAVETAAAKFIWFGTSYAFSGLTFVHQQGPHGVFAVHGYPIGNGVSTFIVETDERSWREAGLDEFDVAQPPGPSDQLTKAYLEKLFADQIDGHPLLENNSRWGNFRTWRTRQWRHRAGPTAIALLGDAAHTAHFSVGSGTKMAMEDAIALVAALDEQAPGPRPSPAAVDAALSAYEAARRPRVARIAEAARPSLSWWEHFGRSYGALPPWQFAYHFFSRSLPESKLRQRDAAFVEAVHEAWRRSHDGSGPLRTPVGVAGLPQPDRVVRVADGVAYLAGGPLPLRAGPPPGGGRWGLWVSAPDTEAGLGHAHDGVARGLAAGASLVAVGDGTPLTRRLLCEAARLERGAVTLLVEDGTAGPATDDMARTEVLSGRTDLVGTRTPSPVAAAGRAEPAAVPRAREEARDG
jgi:2-polyprenyl-6-methoxyphenol hydroxylase-like FAD-dependent oxidoreductase